MKEMKTIGCLGLALGMLFYAVPRLEIGQGITLPSVFGVIWVALILLIIASHLYYILGVNEEKKKELRRVNKFKKWRTQQVLRGQSKLLQVRK